ncbi:MAG TPA: response regulator [Chthoniobacteraceae bacterium]|jgi:DNA-binding response OmpR family regulator
MKILIAEDDPVSLKVLQVTLEHYGHEVIGAADGSDAWDKYDADPVRAVISDWMMPNVDGLELCRRIRERPNTDYTYFILLTAINTGRDNLRKAMDAGVDDFLSKPVDREAIMMRVRVAERILEFTTQIRNLKMLIPICMYCKRVRDDSDYWQQVESYIHHHTGTNFSHGICPDCFTKEMGSFNKRTGLTITPRGAA